MTVSDFGVKRKKYTRITNINTTNQYICTKLYDFYLYTNVFGIINDFFHTYLFHVNKIGIDRPQIDGIAYCEKI